VLGPVLTGFADWMLDECARRDTLRLGCLMREGDFLAELIRRAARYRGITHLDASPLWLNRSVCLRAAVVRADGDDLGLLFAGRTPMAVEALLRRLGLGMSALPSWASHAAPTLDDPVVRDMLLQSIASDATVRDAILTGARTERERVVRLIDDFFAPSPDQVAVVDLG
jgi:hypothetical protein